MSKKQNEIIELDQRYVIIYVPSNTVELELIAKVYENNSIQTVSNTLNLDEVRQAMLEYECAEDMGYIPPDAVFSLNTDV